MARLKQYFSRDEKKEAKAAAKERGQYLWGGKGMPKRGGKSGIVFYYVGEHHPVNPGRFFANSAYTVERVR